MNSKTLTPDPDQHATSVADFRSRGSGFSRVPWSRFDVVIASLMMNLLSLALPIVLLQVYDRIVPNNAKESLVLLVAGVACALILETIIRLARTYVTGWAGACFEHYAGNAAMDSLLNADIASFEKEAAGVHLDRLSGVESMRDFYSSQVVLIFVDLPFSILFLILIGFLGGVLVVVPIAVFTLFVITATVIGSRLRSALERRANSDDRRYNFLIEVLKGIHTFKAMAMEALMVRRFESLQETCASAGHEVTKLSAIANGVGSIFSQLTMIGVVAFGAIFVIDGSLSIGGLAASTLLAGRSLQPLLRASGVWTRYQNIRVAKERFNKIFSLPLESDKATPESGEIKGAIKFCDVHFGYGAESPEILRGVNLDIAAGETIAIKGGNGQGKSTILWLIFGILRPTKGEMLIDGKDVGSYDVASLRRQIAYLPQQGVLFQGSILDNLSMFRGEDHIDSAISSARKLGLDERITRLPRGYETSVGSGSVDGLPGGIKQRFAIARALSDWPPIVLFDEANTSLDREGDDALRNTLDELRGKRTLVLVSHRPSLLNLADRVIELREGQFHESENHANAVVEMSEKVS